MKTEVQDNRHLVMDGSSNEAVATNLHDDESTNAKVVAKEAAKKGELIFQAKSHFKLYFYIPSRFAERQSQTNSSGINVFARIPGSSGFSLRHILCR